MTKIKSRNDLKKKILGIKKKTYLAKNKTKQKNHFFFFAYSQLKVFFK